MTDNGYIWNSDFGRKAKKDPYDNPMGFTGKPSGIISEAEDINRQSRETDHAIGAEALRQRKADPVRIPETDPVRPAPAPAIEPQPEKTDKPDINGTNGTDGNRFGYTDKAYITGRDETARREKEYEAGGTQCQRRLHHRGQRKLPPTASRVQTEDRKPDRLSGDIPGRQ